MDDLSNNTIITYICVVFYNLQNALLCNTLWWDRQHVYFLHPVESVEQLGACRKVIVPRYVSQGYLGLVEILAFLFYL